MFSVEETRLFLFNKPMFSFDRNANFFRPMPQKTLLKQLLLRCKKNKVTFLIRFLREEIGRKINGQYFWE